MTSRPDIALTPIASGSPLLADVRNLYENSFPAEERRPWQEVVRLLDGENRFSMLAITADGSFVGFITLWQLSAAVYGEHFAVAPELRGAGIGGDVLNTLLPRLAKPFVGEVEPPETGPIARRRIEFYARHGLHTFPDFDYLQPPYAPGLPAVRLLLISNSDDLDLPTTAAEIHRTVYGAEN